MSIIAFIPAREGSKSVPHKNIRKIGDHPLIAYSITIAKLLKHVTEIIVSTDSQEIAEISRWYGATVPFMRPKEISQDHSTDLEFFQHYISYLEDEQISIPEYIVHLRPTTPFRKVNVLENGIESFLSDKSATSMRSVSISSVTPYKIFKLNGQYLEGFFPEYPQKEYYNLPRQSFPDSYIPNGYIDIVKTSVISTGSLHGDNILAYITEKVPDIDVLDDYENAKTFLNSSDYTELLKNIRNKNG